MLTQKRRAFKFECIFKRVLEIKPTPDWKGPRKRVAKGNGAIAEPCKAGNCMDLTGHGVPGTVLHGALRPEKEELKLEF